MNTLTQQNYTRRRFHRRVWSCLYEQFARFKALMIRLQHYREVARQRRELAQMPDYLLKDIGISRADAMQEAEKKFWE